MGLAMDTERRYGWMWLRALELADEAERLQRQFLGYIGPGTDAVHWEPPVDIHETADGFILLFALPGVAAEDIEVRLERTALTVSALRRVRLAEPGALIRRLEIPHGRFVREIALSGPALRIADSRHVDGCLEVRLVRERK
jgi:HSP20 family molecular chaperone IbpA